MTPLRVAVVGLGVMGRNHVRILSELEEADLVAVCDASKDAVSRMTRKYRVAGFTSPQELFERAHPDAVTIAVPTGAHEAVAVAAFAHGLHVLVEKPIAPDMQAAERLVRAAERAGRVLAVGHVERFNPAIRELKRRLQRSELGRVFHIRAERLGPFPPRIRDVGVVVDLATHDLDVMRYLLESEPVRLYAETQRRIHTEHEDMLSAMLKFENGTVAMLEVNWVTPAKIRRISVLGERGMFAVDYLTQDLTFYENTLIGSSKRKSEGPASVGEGNVVRYRIEREEPLRLEMLSFLKAATQGTPAEVGGQDGIAALKLALDLVTSGERGRPLDLAAWPRQLTVVDQP